MSKFTKQHHEAVAKILARDVSRDRRRWLGSDDTLHLLTDITTDFCELFRRDNPNFDSEKFIEACQNRE